jgi:hypothetical protein
MSFCMRVGEDVGCICCMRAQRLGDTPRMTAGTVFTIFGKFLYLFAASLVMGLLLGLAAALLLKRFNVSSTPQVCRGHTISSCARMCSHAPPPCTECTPLFCMRSRRLWTPVLGTCRTARACWDRL